jgi:hypothetical protein
VAAADVDQTFSKALPAARADSVDHLPDGVDDQPRLIEIDIMPAVRLGDMRGMEGCRQQVLSGQPLGERDDSPVWLMGCVGCRRLPWPVGAQHDGRTFGQGRSRLDPPDGIQKLDRLGGRRIGHPVDLRPELAAVVLKFFGQWRNVGRPAPSLVEQGSNQLVTSRSGCEHHMPRLGVGIRRR